MSKITKQQNGVLSVPDVPTIPFITGDGVGAEILLIYLSFYILLQSCSEVKVRWFRTNTPYLLN